MLAATPAYLAFALAVVVGPGIAAQRLLRLAIDPALVVPIGTALTAGIYWLSLALGMPWLFPAGIGVLDLGLLLAATPWRRAQGPPLRGAIPPFLALTLLFAGTQYRLNRLGPGGEFLLDPLVASDTAFHVGLSRELALGYPPQVPGVAGFPLGYHLGSDLVRGSALRWAGVDPYDAISRLDLTLGALALVLALRGAAQRAGATAAVVTWVPWTLLATDFSFAFAGNPSAHWWTDLLRGNLLLSLTMANPVVPALALALGSLIALARYEAGEGRGWWALAALQASAVPFFKVFLGAHLLLGLAAALLLGRRRGPGPVVLVAVPCALATARLVLGQGGRTVDVAIAPLDLVHVTRETLGLEPLAGVALLGWALFWLGASLGLRLLGVGPALSALHTGPTVASVLAAMALSAWPLGLLFRVSAPEVLPGQKVVNDAAYLVEQGGPLLWIFTVMALVRIAGSGRRAAIVAVASGLLALPSTLQFAVKKSLEPPDPLPAAMVRAMRALEAVSQPGDVVLQRPGARYPPAPVVLLGRRVPYERFTPYLTQFASREDLERRHDTVYRFFRTTDPHEAGEIARRLGARYLCLYGTDRIRFPAAGLLEPVHEEDAARVYRILSPPARGG